MFLLFDLFLFIIIGFFPFQVGSFTAVCGVLVMALPIPIVVDNFADYYSEQKKLEAKELKEEAAALEAEWEAERHEAAMAGLKLTVLGTDPGSGLLPEAGLNNGGPPGVNNNNNIRR